MVGPAILLVPLAIYGAKKVIDYLSAVVCPQCKKKSVKINFNLYYCKNCYITFKK